MEPWEIIAKDERQDDSIVNYTIFCEDEISEPSYFRSFRKDRVLKINTIENQNKAIRNYHNALKYCRDKGLTQIVNNNTVLNGDCPENIWCVFDRDLENSDLSQINFHDDESFSSSINLAQNAGFKVGWSNDAFELWILLHFEDVPHGMRLHRDYIYERLTEIFKIVQPRNVELDKITSNPHFSYKNSFKRQRHFVIHVLPFLKQEERREQAIARAKALEILYLGNANWHDCNPCTKVHVLVQELLSFQ